MHVPVALQVGVAAGHWLFIVHCTHAGMRPKSWPVLRQCGVAAGQSLSISQATHLPSGAQTGVEVPLVEVPAQFALVTHCTQVDVMVLQWGAAVEVHCASLVQPARQVNVPGLQIGAAVPQSALERHATQRPSPV
jgi:hypothetical protein